MIIRQIEETPIGNCFHDSGILKVVKNLESQVDEFEVDSTKLNDLCDDLISSLKILKGVIKKEEQNAQKAISKEEISDIKRGIK